MIKPDINDEKEQKLQKIDRNYFYCKHSGTEYFSFNKVIYCSCGEVHEPMDLDIKGE